MSTSSSAGSFPWGPAADKWTIRAFPPGENSTSSIPETHPLVQKCMAMGMQPFGSPTLSDQALMPFPSVKLGPGDSARSHSADEFIRISEIEQAIDTYVRLLSDFQL